jgi:hypothetical protein
LLSNINDEDFLQKVHDNEVSFTSGTILVVDLKTSLTMDRNRKVISEKTKYSVIRVNKIKQSKIHKERLKI